MQKAESLRADSIRQSIAILYQALDKLDNHELGMALIMVGVAKQMVSDTQMELDHYVTIKHQMQAVIED